MTSPKKTNSATRIATSASSRSAGVRPCGRAAGGRGGRVPLPPRRGRRTPRDGLWASVVGGSSSKKSNSMSSSRGSISRRMYPVPRSERPGSRVFAGIAAPAKYLPRVSSAAPAHDLFLGRYRPLRPLGSGGMGHVWLARDERSGLDIALKIVAREGKSGHRAEREARAAAALRHPRCQRILSLARDPSHVYIAYEYIPGRTLREAMRSGELDDAAAIEVAAQIADALAHAHGRGIIHRDVKPSNVLLAETGGVDVRLLDFGLAQMAEFDTLTGLGDIPGTLAYISPERLQGQPATPAADVWALGVLLWEALAGEHPFWGGDLTDTSSRIQHGAPALETMRPDLPRHVIDTVTSALAPSPQRRPSASRLAHELRSLPKRRRGKRPSKPTTPPGTKLELVTDRVLPGALAGLASGWISAALPFFPAHWPAGLALVGAALGFAAPRAGLAFALGVAFFPLANISLGLAAVYAAVATCWAALNWRDARSGLLFA